MGLDATFTVEYPDTYTNSIYFRKFRGAHEFIVKWWTAKTGKTEDDMYGVKIRLNKRMLRDLCKRCACVWRQRCAIMTEAILPWTGEPDPGQEKYGESYFIAAEKLWQFLSESLAVNGTKFWYCADW